MTLLRLGLLALLTCLLSGCQKENQPPPAVALEETPKTIESSFAQAPESAKQAASEAAAAIRSSNPSRAWASLQELSARSDLTPEQRQAAAQSLIAVGKELNDAAARGDRSAQQVLELHRAHK